MSLCARAGEGPLYSLLHVLVFGDDRSEDRLQLAEEGGAAMETKQPGPPKEAETTAMEYFVKLALCTVGLQASYLTWGVLQVSSCVWVYSRLCGSTVVYSLVYRSSEALSCTE